MEPKKQIAATARTRTPSANSGASVLQSLQNENDALRSELLRSKQHEAQLQRQLNDLHRVAEQIVREAAMSTKEQVRALEERCRLLADRLVGSKREEQVTETARVAFLLRSQIEERRFLKRGLEAMQEVLAGTGGHTASASRSGQLSTNAPLRLLDDEEWEAEVHTGDLYRLMMTVSDALHGHTASEKLEKARIRLTLEQAASLLGELCDAVEDATRAAFDAAVQASVVYDGGTTFAAGGDALQLSSVLMVPRATPATTAQNASGFTPAHRHGDRPAGSADTASSLRRQDAGASPFAYSAIAPSASAQLALELEWVCDVLKACMKGAAEVRALIETAVEGLKAPPPLLERRQDVGDRSSTAEHVHPLASAASPEMNALLRSFLEDLCIIKQRAARQQEDMARQLAREVERHFQSTQQYEQRVKLLEAECTRLLGYVERQATQRSGVDAVTQSPIRRSAAESATLMPALVPIQDTRVTPERYVASCDVSKVSEPRRARPSGKLSAAPSRAPLDDQRTSPRVSGRPRPKELGSAAPWASAGHAMEVDHPGHANHHISSHYSLPDLSLNRPSSPSKPSTTAVPIVPSPAASSIWSAHRSERVGPPRRALEATRPTPRPRSRLLSPAPPPVYPQAPPTASASTTPIHNLSPGRRSTTASTSSRPRGTVPFRTDTPTATPPSGPSASKRRFSVPPDNAVGGLVSSQKRNRTAAAALTTAEPPPAITAAAVPRTSTPLPSDTSIATSRRGQEMSGCHTRLSQELYEEAAADLFSFNSSISTDALSALSSVRRLRLESSRVSDIDSTAVMRTPSPRRPAKRPSYFNGTSPGRDAALRIRQQPHTPPAPLSRVLSGHAPGGGSGVDTSRGVETPSTPPIWRRIKEEASFHCQHLSSPTAGDAASMLFGTPREVP
ncbi:hypothetical protein GH5_04106 [Leishmania sp. Ghana 2012 LV757]|uniref:hypothetical protein n=1 Tax=Leishmania sp. Ghana 2012 LV757 TaxID=2803181 RepID=UPI001B6AD5AD|nr:hypothetical protein GH5_04106 [Leishmania sp. Ghana 2012 LV757]